jgi:hypothetical protein
MNRCFFSNLIFITILIFVCNSYGDSTSLPLLTMDLSVTEQIQPESKINSISSTELQRKISAAKSIRGNRFVIVDFRKNTGNRRYGNTCIR